MEELNLERAKKVMIEILIDIDKVCNANGINYWIDFGTLLGAVRHKGFIPWDDDIDISMPRNDYEKFKKIVNNELSSDYFLQTKSENKHCFSDWIKIMDKKSIFIESDNIEKYAKMKNGIFVDIFPLDRIQTKSINRFNFLRKLFQINPFKPFYNSRKNKFLHYFFSPISLFRSVFYEISKNITDENGETAIFGVETWFSHYFDFELIYPLKKIEFEGLMFNAPNNWDKILQSYYGDYMELPPKHQRIGHANRIIFLE